MRQRRWIVLAVAALLLLGLGALGRPATASSPKAAAVPAAATTTAATTTSAPSTATRYSLVHGCYDLRTADGSMLVPADAPYRMQATTLGQYLLYGVHRDVLADGSSGIAPAPAPSRAAEWRVDGTHDTGYTITNLGTGKRLAVTFVKGTGCAVYPEAQVGASGSTFKGTSPTGPVTGTIDAHVHVTAFEFLGGDFHCGRPWHKYGAPYALPDCARYERGTNGAAESFLDYGTPIHPHDTVGWPTFHEWPSPTALAEEGTYYTGIERAWLAGLRVMVVQFVDNEALCMLMTTRHNPCNDMKSVEIQARDLHALQDYIDAQAGGPGKGFFRIVTSPAQARAVANAGKLAVVEGIEVSDVLNCGELLGIPKCNTLQVDAGLQHLWDLGVRSFFPIHKFDNAFGGTKMDGGETGILSNIGNKAETGNFWNVHTCTGPAVDQPQLIAAPVAGDVAGFLNDAATTLIGGAVLPVYPPAPHCNTRGLTNLGVYVINQMIRRHFIIELDHMDVKSGDAALGILEAAHYSGVISSHSWDSAEEQNPRVYQLGGFVTPYAGSAESYVDEWRAARAMADPSYAYGIGYGSDMNGLGAQGGPTSAHPISYPFPAYGGDVTFQRETWGQRTFDINTDGVANYGLYADWLQALQGIAGPQIMDDMYNGAEAYLEMWERADSH